MSSLPIINYKATNITLHETWPEILEQKFSSLEKYIGNETDVRCDVEFEQTTSKHSGSIYRAEVNFWMAGDLYRVEAVEEQMEKAIDEARDELDKQLRRTANKREGLARRGGQMMKKFLQRT